MMRFLASPAPQHCDTKALIKFQIDQDEFHRDKRDQSGEYEQQGGYNEDCTVILTTCTLFNRPCAL
jgi:hypothetical protein